MRHGECCHGVKGATTATHRENPTKNSVNSPGTTHPGLVCVSVVKKLFDSGVEDQWLK
jgi:hypothetical protein